MLTVSTIGFSTKSTTGGGAGWACADAKASVASKNTLRIRNIPMTVRRDDNPIPMKYRVLGGRPSSRTTIVGVRAVVAELGGFVSHTSAERHEIGRAACRERVCQNV